MPNQLQTHTAERSARKGAALGLRLPGAAIPPISWNAWQVVERAHGFHVSRESGSGIVTEFLRNEVGGLKVFRKRPLADAACAKANFTVTAQRLSADPMLGGTARSTAS